MTVDHAGLAKLREPFPAEAVGKLPRVWCKACRDSNAKVCSDHGPKRRCDACKNSITPAHIDLDYVGHAAVTDRLREVDPEWNWEPVAWDEEGAPLVQRLDRRAVMWIRLTVCGMTRLGVGVAPGGKEEVEKELISDALRNAAMRFGVALDLWSKEDLAGSGGGGGGDSPNPSDTEQVDSEATGQAAQPASSTSADLCPGCNKSAKDGQVLKPGRVDGLLWHQSCWDERPM